MVAGHTDSTRVSRPETIQAGHKDNWYLSAHRAIAVAEELQKQGVNGQRLGVIGYADKRPVAGNDTAAGRAQNRRVEVLILPTTVHASSASDHSGSTKHRAKKAAPDMNKDNPAMNMNK
jgi:chemotaxis protein MotB